MSTLGRYDVLVVGAGHAGAQLAVSLRQRKFVGTIAIVGDEPHLPYERPPLSKEYLHGERAFERMLLRPEVFWREREISLLLGNAVVSLNPAERTVTLANDKVIQYGTLVWAAGGRPRTLSCSGSELQGIHAIRSRGDVDTLREQLPSAERIAIVGGGYIGLEAAAALCKLGKQVTVVEALDRVLARVTAEPLSRFVEAEHRAQGVDIRLDTKIECVEGNGTRVSGLRIEGGGLIPADLIIVGIGVTPVVEPLIAAGAEGGNGVAVDEHGRTSLPHVFAIGDCALHANPFAGGSMVRLESVQNASDMATTVAKAITREPEAYCAVPWFWSNQYGLRLQTVGLFSRHDDTVLRGDMASGSFSIVYRRQGRVIALDCVNAPKDFIQGRALVQNNVAARSSDLADTSVSLRDLATRSLMPA
ncbi:MAG: FAD-dependent oxidoreductase [Gammaproteobacteria bacterium]